jgi:acyl-CoA thioester hydrolase
MFTSEVKIRVRYGETDRMGYVYYGNYAEYFEVGRVEALRELGLSYREMEDSGILLPVSDYSIKYLKPAYYDELLTLRTSIPEIPSGPRLKFLYETFNDAGTKLNFGETILVFVKKESGRPVPPPDSFLDKMRKFFP